MNRGKGRVVAKRTSGPGSRGGAARVSDVPDGPLSPIEAAMDALTLVRTGEAGLLAAAWAFVQDVAARDAADLDDPQAWDSAGPIAGEGTPVVFAGVEEEFGAPLGMSARGADRLLSDAAELAVRLPRVWARVGQGTLDPKRARFLAKNTQNLTAEAAAWVDAYAETIIDKLSFTRIQRLTEEAQIRFGDYPTDDEAETLHHVTITPQPARGLSTVTMCLDSDDAHRLDQSLTHLAAHLKTLGDTSPLDTRRAKAAGLLASPQQCLDLLATTPDQANTTHAHHDPTDPRLLATRGSLPTVQLIVRIDATTLTTLNTTGDTVDTSAVAPGRGTDGAVAGGGVGPGGHPVARTDRLGAQALDVIRRWIGHHQVIVKPILDLGATTTRGIDAYEIPASLRTTITETHPTCVFPWCQCRSDICDLDHITPYNHTPPRNPGDPPGGPPTRLPQTRYENLAPLCRKHHLMKTHRGWTYHREENTDPKTGQTHTTYHWTSPQGHHFTINPWGTTSL